MLFRRKKARDVLAYVLTVLLLLAPLIVPAYVRWNIRDAALLGLAALSLDFLWGRAGLMSFGHAVFFGIGAYTAAIATTLLQLNGLCGIIIGAAAGAIFGFALGSIILGGRVRGAYFTMITLAAAIVGEYVAIGWVQVTGGDAGITGVPSCEVKLFGISFFARGGMLEYYAAILMLVVSLFALMRYTRSRQGRILHALVEDEERVEALGYNTTSRLISVFGISGGLAAASGAAYCTMNGFVVPDLIGPVLSTEILLWVALGVRGSLVGPAVAALLAWRLQQVVSSYHPQIWPLMIGGCFILIARLFLRGRTQSTTESTYNNSDLYIQEP